MALYDSVLAFYKRRRHDWHERRADLLVALMGLAPGQRVLDLGGGSGEFMQRVLARCEVRVTVADVERAALARATAAGFDTVQLIEGGPLPFGDLAFDVVACNSVIEHVTLPKTECATRRISQAEWARRSLESQRAFAGEIRRIGRRYFVQTPHRAFPIEAHTWLPFVGWLAHDTTAKIVRIADRVWVKRCGYADWNLLDDDDMRRLFPGCEIHIERTLGLPKSLIAYSR